MITRCLCLLPAALLALPLQAEPLKLRVCYEATELQPYFNGKDEVPRHNPGLVIEQLLLPAAKHAGFTVELYRRPWNRCMSDMQNNQTDAILPAAWTVERESWARFPGPQRNLADGVDPAYSGWSANYSVIVARDSTLEWDGNTFHNLQRGLAAPLGHLANQRLQAMGVLLGSNIRPDTALNMILHQRLDGYVLEELIAQSLIAQNDLQGQLKLLQPPLYRSDWYVPVTHAFYAAQPEQVWRFWENLAEQRHRLESTIKQQLHNKAIAKAQH